MKNVNPLLLSLAFVTCLTISTMAQVAVNTTGDLPDGSAMLDVKSSSKGVLVPRMSSVDKGNIGSPVAGLLVYQTDNTPGFYYYDGAAWIRLSTSGPGSGIPAPAGAILNNLLTFDGSNWLAKTLVLGNTGSGQPISVRDPYLTLNFCIAMQGIFPSQSGIDPFLGEIEIFGFNFAPQGWAMCNGQLLSISQNMALFSLLGTTYGGNGVSNFALPDLRGRNPIHYGTGPGLSTYFEGQVGGSETITLNPSQLPSHSHTITYQSNP